MTKEIEEKKKTEIIQGLEKKIQQLEKEILHYKVRHKTIYKKYVREQQQNAVLKREIAVLKRKYTDLQRTIDDQQRTIADQQRTIADLQRQINDLASRKHYCSIQ